MPRIDPFAVAHRPKPTRPIAYDFVLDRLAPLAPITRPMFGSHGVYLDERVICILRHKGDPDDGVWVCFEPEAENEVLALLPNLKRIERLGHIRNWRKLAASSPSFEDDVLKVCALLLAGDTRIGKLPDRLKAKRKAPAATSKAGGPKLGKARVKPARSKSIDPPARTTKRAASSTKKRARR